MSGKSSRSGFGLIGVLCAPGYPLDHGGACPGLVPSFDEYGGGYAFTKGIDGAFDIDRRRGS